MIYEIGIDNAIDDAELALYVNKLNPEYEIVRFSLPEKFGSYWLFVTINIGR